MAPGFKTIAQPMHRTRGRPEHALARLRDKVAERRQRDELAVREQVDEPRQSVGWTARTSADSWHITVRHDSLAARPAATMCSAIGGK